MTLKNLVKICIAAVLIFLVLFGVLSIRVSLFKQLLLVALVLPFTYLCVYLIFWHGEKFLSLFEWMTRPRLKPPAFSCVRCQSLRVIIHERLERGFLHRYFWCKDCGYEWSNIDPNPPTDVKSTKA
jgi:type IV secretory pathway VirB3-like protein